MASDVSDGGEPVRNRQRNDGGIILIQLLQIAQLRHEFLRAIVARWNQSIFQDESSNPFSIQPFCDFDALAIDGEGVEPSSRAYYDGRSVRQLRGRYVSRKRWLTDVCHDLGVPNL